MTVHLVNGKVVPASSEYASRADEVFELLEAVKHLIIPFIRSADPSSSASSSSIYPSTTEVPRNVLVDAKTPQELSPFLQLDLPVQGVGKEGLMEMIEKVLQFSVNTWDQGFMDKLYASTNAVGVVSELILAVLNTNVHVYQVSPVLTLVEKHVTRSLASLFGFNGPHSGGMSQPGGSASNSSSIIIARNTLHPETKSKGLGSNRYILFTSAHGHYSLEKAAQMFGFGSDNVRSVPVDALGRMDARELRKMIVVAREAGEIPFYVNATAGTTVLGSYDPFDEIADVCEEFDLWFHVDGSWGGCVIFDEEISKTRLKGAERADSLTVNPHKMLGVPVTCSFLLGKDMRKFWKAMTLPAGYLFHNDGSDEIYDLADLTPQCGRRGDALKMHLSWLYYGSAGFANKVRTAFTRAEQLYTLLSESENILMVSTKPLPCLQVCFYYAPKGVRGEAEVVSRQTAEIVRRLVGRGFMIDYAPGEQGKFFRVVVSSGTTSETVERLVSEIEVLGREVWEGR